MLDKMTSTTYYHLSDMILDREPFNHPFFKTQKWKEMLRSDSLYFSGRADSHVFVQKFRDCDPVYSLNVRCNLKNYDDEVELFLDWLKPYILTEGFLGYSRYEEDQWPTLLFMENGELKSYTHNKDKERSWRKWRS